MGKARRHYFVSHEQSVKRNKQKEKKVECVSPGLKASFLICPNKKKIPSRSSNTNSTWNNNLLSRKVLLLKLWEDARWSQWDFFQMVLYKEVIKRFWVEIRICQFIHTCKINFFHHGLMNFGAKSYLIYLKKQNMSWISVPHPLNEEVNT